MLQKLWWRLNCGGGGGVPLTQKDKLKSSLVDDSFVKLKLQDMFYDRDEIS